MIILESTITCPECDFAKTEEMPTNACIHFYECEGCGVRCPPQQESSRAVQHCK